MHEQRWTSIESRRVTAAVDQEALADLDELVRELGQLARRLPAVLHLMRDDMAGQPRAAAPGGGGAPRPWCWAHEQETERCHEAGFTDEKGRQCWGEIITGPSDPTGTAGILPDHAARDHQAVLRKIGHLKSNAHQLLGLAAAYPTHAAEREQLEVDDEVGSVWCRSCWKDNKYCEPVYIAPKKDKPMYAGLCLWCGRTRHAIGGSRLKVTDQRGDPPTWLVAKRHRGDRVTPADLDRAAASVPAPEPTPGKKGKRRK